MAAKKASPAMEFIVELLKKDKNTTYADIKAAADAKQIDVYPIMYGRAQALLGLVESKPRGQGKAAKAKAEERRAAGERVAAAQTTIDTGSLEGIIAAVRSSEQAKVRYRSALEKIQSILGAALG